jgi:hypothetical protein
MDTIDLVKKSRKGNKRIAKKDALALVSALAVAPTKTEAMLMAGYSKSTAEHSSTRTERLAVERVAEMAEQGNATASALLDVISRKEIVERLRYLALESNSDAVSLSALKPFSKAIGIDYDDRPVEKTAPPVLIGIVNTPNGIQSTPQNTP